MKFIKSILKKPFIETYGRLIVIIFVGVVIGASLLGKHYLSSKPASQNLPAVSASSSPSSQSQATVTPNTNLKLPSPTTPTQSTNPSTTSPTTSLPKAQENPVIAWENNYGGMSATLGNDVNRLDSVLSSCGTINPDYESICTATYDATSTSSLCEQLQNDTNTAKSYPSLPYAPANTNWQNALSLFGTASQTCITNINAGNQVGTNETDVGSIVKEDYTAGVNDLLAMGSEVTTYEQQAGL